MSLTAYYTLVFSTSETRTHASERARAPLSLSLSLSHPREQQPGGLLPAPPPRALLFPLCYDTRPSGERESGSYSGTRQRNRIQFGPS